MTLPFFLKFYSHSSLKCRVLPMICDASLMSAAKNKKKREFPFCGFLRGICVHAHTVYEPVFTLYQSISTCEQHCSVRRSVAALWLSVTSASMEQCSSVAVQTNVYPTESSRQIKPAAPSQAKKSQLKRANHK